MPIALASAPEQGQLVSVRSRNWIINEVVPSTLPTSVLHGISDPQILVSLASDHTSRKINYRNFIRADP